MCHMLKQIIHNAMFSEKPVVVAECSYVFGNMILVCM